MIGPLFESMFGPMLGTMFDTGGGPTPPAHAIQDRAGDYILDRAGNFIEERS